MRGFLALCFGFLISQTVFSQSPAHWVFTAKKADDGKWRLSIDVKVNAPWHIYSQTTAEGGPLPTKISFNKNPLISFMGTTTELGDLKTVHDETFGVDVKFFLGDVEFVQVVKLKGKAKTKLTGTVEFMACTDRQCLPPKAVPFSVELDPD